MPCILKFRHLSNLDIHCQIPKLALPAIYKRSNMFTNQRCPIESIRFIPRDNVVTQMLKIKFTIVFMFASGFFIKIHKHHKVGHKLIFF